MAESTLSMPSDNSSKEIKTFLFFDIETTGLPEYENNKTKITEISLMAITRDQLQQYSNYNIFPRVVNKLNLCFNPGRLIHFDSTRLSGLDNLMLETAPRFNEHSANLIKDFIEHQPQPVCLIAHNGLKFDVPVLKKMLGVHIQNWPKDLRFVDSMLAFMALDELSKANIVSDQLLESNNQIDDINPYTEAITTKETVLKQSSNVLMETDESDTNKVLSMQMKNELTPQQQKILKPVIHPNSQDENVRIDSRSVKRQLFTDSRRYRLIDIYQRYYNEVPRQLHYAECDVYVLIKCAMAERDRFVEYTDTQSINFMDIPSL